MVLKLICATQGQGKTTFLRQYLAHRARQGRSVGGVVAPVVYEAGQRVGYDLIDLGTGDRQPLARMGAPIAGSVETGKFRFFPRAISDGNTAIMAAVREERLVIAIDEVGPLEFAGQGWAPAVEVALLESRDDQELVLVVRPSLIDDLPGRFPCRAWSATERVSPPWPEPAEG